MDNFCGQVQALGKKEFLEYLEQKTQRDWDLLEHEFSCNACRKILRNLMIQCKEEDEDFRDRVEEEAELMGELLVRESRPLFSEEEIQKSNERIIASLKKTRAASLEVTKEVDWNSEIEKLLHEQEEVSFYQWRPKEWHNSILEDNLAFGRGTNEAKEQILKLPDQSGEVIRKGDHLEVKLFLPQGMDLEIFYREGWIPLVWDSERGCYYGIFEFEDLGTHKSQPDVKVRRREMK